MPPSTAAKPLRRRLPATVILLGLTSFFTDVGSELVFPLLPAFVASLGAGTAFLGLVEGIADATSSLLKLASGHVSDRFPRRKPLVLFGYGVAAAARPLIALATLPWHVLAVRVTDRVGKGLRSTPRDVLIASAVPKEDTGRAFGLHHAMDHAGAVVGPLLATLLLWAGLPLRQVFALALIPGVLSVLSVLLVREPRTLSEAPLPPPADAAAIAAVGLPPRLKSYLAIVALFALGNSSDAFLLLRARELGVAGGWLPLLWATFNATKLVSSYVGGDLSDRVPRTRLILAGFSVYAATYLAFGLATQSWQAWGLFILYGCYYGLAEPAEKALVKDLAPPEVRGRAYGAYNFLLGISAIPAGLLTGGLWQAFGPLAALGTGAALALVSAAALALWARRSA